MKISCSENSFILNNCTYKEFVSYLCVDLQPNKITFTPFETAKQNTREHFNIEVGDCEIRSGIFTYSNEKATTAALQMFLMPETIKMRQI